MKTKFLSTIGTTFTLMLFGGATMKAQSVFEKDGFGVSVNADITTEEIPDLLVGPPGPISGLYWPPFVHYIIDEQWGIGATALYSWHPFKSVANSNFAKFFFTEFGLGGVFSRYGINDAFLFNSHIFLGYTFAFNKIGIDIFTGPTAKFAPYTQNYEGPYGYVYKDNGSESSLPTDVSQLPVYNFKMYTGGVTWSFGAGINVKNFGIFAHYNLSLTDFEHLTVKEVKPQNQKIKFPNNKYYNSVTVGLKYYFR